MWTKGNMLRVITILSEFVLGNRKNCEKNEVSTLFSLRLHVQYFLSYYLRIYYLKLSYTVKLKSNMNRKYQEHINMKYILFRLMQIVLFDDCINQIITSAQTFKI